jgi:hypothetical protein
MGDLDGDLDLDVAVSNSSSSCRRNYVSVSLNNGHGTSFARVTYGASPGARSVALGDLDGDLHLDVAMANWRNENVTVLLNLCMAEACPWDLNDDGVVGIGDLLALLAAWGTNPGGPPDFDGDGTVGIFDLLELLANWGACL